MQNHKSRRQVFGNILVIGSALALFSKAKARWGTKKSETIKLISKDGKVVEIDRKHIPTMCGGKVSNKRLSKWLGEKEIRNG